MNIYMFMVCSLLSMVLIGCGHLNSGNDGQLQSYPAPIIEAGWIRNGEPIEFENYKWYAADDVEVLQDNEVFQVTDYKGIQVFVDKMDIKPYERLYTKFAKNKYRFYERRVND